MGQWKHLKHTKNDHISDPTESAFFSNEAVGSISTALVREAIQNVLDEIKDGVKLINGPARVKITLSGSKYALPAEYSRKLLSGLIPHLVAENNGIIPSELPDFNCPMPFVLFEDFNTNGLEGDPAEYLLDDVKQKGKPHNFYFFYRAVGRSGKLFNKMGSWGVGKSVFHAVSKINCFWAVTVRDSDKEAYLIGQSVLKTHNRADEPADCGYVPYGHYGIFEPDGFAMPETSLGEIQVFQQMFRLKRRIADRKEEREAHTGLSIIIPFPRDEVTSESLALSAIKQFFYPIIKGRLEVEIQHEDHIAVLRKDTLRKEVNKLDFSMLPDREIPDKSRILSLFDFAEWITGLKDQDYIRLTADKANSAYLWRMELFRNTDRVRLQMRFDKGEPLAFIVPVKYQPAHATPELREFSVYITRDFSLQEPESIFIRDSLTISGVRSLKRKGVRGIVIISDKDLVTFFGQAESPAHTGWHKDNFRTRYESTDEIISFVQKSLDRLYDFLQMPAEGLDKTLLNNLFYINSPDDGEGNNGGNKKGRKTNMRKILIPPSRSPEKYIVTRLRRENGLRITANPASGEIPGSVRVTLAYMRPDANPFKKFSPFDFNVKQMDVSFIRAVSTVCDGNIIEFIPKDHRFELRVTGFDKNRDLAIRVN